MRAVTETELEREVRRLLVVHGLARVSFHVPDSRRVTPGLPDWIIIGRTVLWRELKSPWGGLTREQWHIGHLLMEAGQDWAVWRPADYTSGRVEREIAAVRPT